MRRVKLRAHPFGLKILCQAGGLVITPFLPAAFSPLTPAAATITPTTFAPTVSPIPPAIMPVAPSGQLGAALFGILFGLFDHRAADARDSFRNCCLGGIGGIHLGGTAVWYRAGARQ